MGSQNLISAIQRVVLLQRYGPVGIAIVFLWLLSPLGGQTSLRILGVVPSSVLSTAQIQYFDVNYTGQSMFTTGDTFNTGVSAMFQANLLASEQVKKSPVDVWNNVKVPMIDQMSPWTPEMSDNPWITVDQSSKNTTYASLSGIIIIGFPSAGKSVFNIETSYIQLQCSNGQEFLP